MKRFLTLLGALALASTGFADHPECTDEDAVAVGTGGTIFYVSNELCQPDGCLFSLWVYQESNGHPGLQRPHDEVHDHDPQCWMLASDSIVL